MIDRRKSVEHNTLRCFDIAGMWSCHINKVLSIKVIHEPGNVRYFYHECDKSKVCEIITWQEKIIVETAIHQDLGSCEHEFLMGPDLCTKSVDILKKRIMIDHRKHNAVLMVINNALLGEFLSNFVFHTKDQDIFYQESLNYEFRHEIVLP